MKKQKLVSTLLLFITALIWGVAFVAQSQADSIGAFTFNCTRSIVGGVALIPVVFIFGKRPTEEAHVRRKNRKYLFAYGAVCGAFLTVGSAFQQLAINLGSSTGKAGFITACYIIFVPIIGVIMGKKTSKFLWLAVILAAVGLYLLCMTDSLNFKYSDILLFGGAIGFSLQILAIDRCIDRVDGVKLACVQFFTCGILSGIMMFVFEKPTFDGLLSAWQPIMYTGLFSSGIGYTFQIIGQKGLNPTVASLIMSLESAFAAISGWLLLDQTMKPREIVGCAVMFVAILLAQLPRDIFAAKKRGRILGNRGKRDTVKISE